MSFVAAESGAKMEEGEYILVGYKIFADVLNTLKEMQKQTSQIMTYVIRDNSNGQIFTARYLISKDKMDVYEITSEYYLNKKLESGKKDPHTEMLMGEKITEKVNTPYDDFIWCYDTLTLALPEYEPLIKVLFQALDQSAFGKGKERHVKEGAIKFLDQPIVQLQKLFGPGYAFGQATKKIEESQRLSPEKAKAEILGAIVYTAAGLIYQEQYVWKETEGNKNAGESHG